MKTNLTLIWMGILTLCFSCKHHTSTTSEENKFQIPKEEWEKKIGTWIMGYERYASPNEVCRIIHCYRTLFDTLGATPKPPKIYPEYYGGVLRFRKDHAKKVVLLTDTTKQTRDEFIQLCQITSDNISYRLCDYSVNELSLLTRELRENIDTLTKNLGVSHIRCSIIKNRVIVYFPGDRDENKIQRFKTEVSDSPMLMFQFKSEPKDQEAIESTLEPIRSSIDLVFYEGKGELVWTEMPLPSQ